MDATISLRDGRKMPAVGFGTYLMSSEQCEDAVLHALNTGYRHIDTAEFYDNHRGCAKAIKASNVDRKDIWITDKVSPNGFFDMPCRTYDEVLAALRSRLSMLETEYVDLYLLHHAFAKDERLNQWRALVEAQKLGLAKHIGVSNWGEKHFKEIEEAGLPIPEVNQIEVHPICSQKDVIAYMKTKGITVVAYSSLAPLSTWRTEPEQSSLPIEDLSHQAVIAEVVSHYKDQDVSEAQLMLRWAIQKGYGVLPKSCRPERIVTNIKLFHFEISPEDMATLDGLDKNMAIAWPIGNPMTCD